MSPRPPTPEPLPPPRPGKPAEPAVPTVPDQDSPGRHIDDPERVPEPNEPA